MIIAIINIIAFIIALIGCINWGLVAIFNWNLVEAIFGVGRNGGTITIYVLVLLSAIWLIFASIFQKSKIVFCPNQTERLETTHYNVKSDNKRA